jgi:hypothetical protein
MRRSKRSMRRYNLSSHAKILDRRRKILHSTPLIYALHPSKLTKHRPKIGFTILITISLPLFLIVKNE